MPGFVSRLRPSIAALLSLLMLTTPAWAAKARQVLWVEGIIKAKQTRDRKSPSRELQPTDSLRGKLRILMPAGSALWLLADQRDLIGLHGPGSWEIFEDSPIRGDGDLTRIAVHEIELDKGPIVPWIELAPPDGAKRRAVPTSPEETAVTTRRPVLRWRNEPGVLRIALTLLERNPTGEERLVETWQGLTGSHHEVRRPLKPGHDYAWRLVANGDVNALTQAKDEANIWFHVLSDASIQSARRADAVISSLQLDHPKASKALNVLRALTWEKYGLAAEAQKAWDDITAEAGDVEALRLYRARLNLRALARPRLKPPAATPTSETKRP